MLASLLRKARKFFAGESPAHRHRVIRESMIGVYHIIILGLFYYGILTPLSFALRTFHGPFLEKNGTWKKRN
ncbi:MAG TPA: hypothetical protein VJK72_01225 [Candidatus Nanoarchaeia archaeon]|nr:hypothetical protein [Candidatus Nanoarchaeia archaeon]